MSILGSRVLRVEDPRLLTAGGTYCADVRDRRLDGAVHATYVRSTVAHARLVSVDVDAARALPGVVDVIAGGDVDLAPIPGWFNPAMVRTHLARDRVRFVGEPLAVVLTERPDQGEDAAEAVGVDYEPLPALVDPMAALTSEVRLFPEVGTNVVCEFSQPARDGPDALDDCEVVVRQRLVNQRVAACPLEVRSSAAAWVEGRLHVWCSTQNPHAVRGALAVLYAIDEGDVAVVAPDVGGGFGAKIDLHPEDLLLPWLARRCGRPVRWVESRSENLLAMVQGRAQVQDVAIGGRRDGTHRGLPPVDRAGRRCLPEHGRLPADADPGDGGRHLRHPGRRGRCPGGGHHDPAGRRLPGRGPARGHGRHRAGGRPVRGRGGDGPGRRAPAQPAGPVRRAPHHTHRGDLRLRRLPRGVGAGAAGGRLRRAARRAAPAPPAGGPHGPGHRCRRLRGGDRRSVGWERVRPRRGAAPRP